jgi:hypothetical protein
LIFDVVAFATGSANLTSEQVADCAMKWVLLLMPPSPIQKSKRFDKNFANKFKN